MSAKLRFRETEAMPPNPEPQIHDWAGGGGGEGREVKVVQASQA